MATVEEILAKANEWEAAGNAANAAKLRAYAKTVPQPAPRDAASVLSKADEWEAAGQSDKAAKLRAYAATLAPPTPATDAPINDAARVAPAPPSLPAIDAATGLVMASTPPRALSESEIGSNLATDFAGFEMFNPELAGRYTPETMPRPGEVVMGAGGGGRSGGARLTVRDWRDKPSEQFGDAARAVMSGPVDAMQSFTGGLSGGPSPSRDYLAKDPLTSGLPGPVLTGLGAVGDIGGAGLSALGAGIAGGIGLATELVPGQTGASREKLAGELIGMSQFAVPELAGVSSVAGRAAAGASKSLPKPVELARNIAIEKPSVETLRGAKTAAYKAVDDAGESFSAEQMAGLRDRVKADLESGNYVSGVDRQSDAVLSLLDRKSGEPMTLSQLDKLRQEFYKRLSAAPNEVGIEDAIDAIDDMIASNPASGELMQAARAANAKYKKVETLDLAFQKARDQTASTGSGGNILNKYRQAVTSIVNAPKKAKWYSKEELATMREFIEGTKGENSLRLMGKLSPNGNGLMMALNLFGAGATGGASLAVTGLAVGAKALADRGALRGTTRLMQKVGGAADDAKPAAKPARKPAEGDIIIGPLMPAAPIAAQEAANSNRNPEYDALLGRYK